MNRPLDPSTDTSTNLAINVVTKIRLYKCAKCGTKKSADMFGKNPDSSTGLQTYCKQCKNALGKKRLQINVSARIRHHFATRIASTLGNLAPNSLVRDLEVYLDYNLNALTKKLNEEVKAEHGLTLREALNEGWHIDHIKPLSLFPYITADKKSVDWDIFKECWAISNLKVIPAAENLAKGAKYNE